MCAGKLLKTQDNTDSALDETKFQCGALVSSVERVVFHGMLHALSVH